MWVTGIVRGSAEAISPASRADCPVGRAVIPIWLERFSREGSLAFPEISADILHMTKDLERAFLRGLKLAIAMPSHVADGVGKAYRTLRAYQEGSRPVTADAAHGLVKYLRRQAGAML